MTTCHSIDALITPFVDGELDDTDRRAVEEHLRRCAPCHSREAAERTIRGLIQARRAPLQSMQAPAALRTVCAAFARPVLSPQSSDLNHSTRPATDDRRLATARGAGWRARLTPYALAASLVVIVGGAFLYQATDTSAQLLAAELTADHVKCFALNRALGTHQLPAAVESSLASGFGWRAHLPEDPERAGLELVGARPCLYGKGKVAHIMYRQNGNPVSLFMLPDTAHTEQLVEVLGHEAKIWCVGNRTFVLVAQQTKPEVERLASFVQAGLQ